MKSETLKLIFGYSIVGFVIVAGIIELDRLASHDLAAGTDVTFRLAMVGIIAGIIGSAMQFVTGNEIATRTANQAIRSFSAGASSSAQPTVTAQSPSTMTVTPTPASDPGETGGTS